MINPRLEGLPYSQCCSFFVFFCVIGINLFLAQYLASTRTQIIGVTLNSLELSQFERDNFEGCGLLDFQDSFRFRFQSDLFGAGTRVFVSASLFNLFDFELQDIKLPSDELNVLRESCSQDFDLLDNSTFCLSPENLETVAEVTVLESARPLSLVGIPRSDGDNFVRLSFPEVESLIEYEVYISRFTSSVVFSITALERRSLDVFVDLVVFPVLSHLENPETELNRLLFIAFEALVGNNEDTDVVSRALSKSFVTCQTEEALSAFAYFGLMFDFAFFLEGFFSVLVALLFLFGIKGFRSLLAANSEKTEEDTTEIETAEDAHESS